MNERLDFFRKKLNIYTPRIHTRYKQYDMKYQDANLSVVIPKEVSHRYRSVMGWCSKAVDALADRLVFRDLEFDYLDMMSIFNRNNPDILFDNAILSALIASCSFIYISKDERDEVRLQVIEADNATGSIDPITGMLKDGYAVLERDKEGNAVLEAYFEPYRTVIITTVNNKEQYQEYKHKAPYPLLVPIIHRPDAVRPFGRSRITRSAEYWQALAKRTLERAEVTSEFYSFPQKYVLGMSSDAESFDTWKATIASLLRIDQDEEGKIPSVGQFQTSSMAPFIDQLRMAASGFAGETGLTLDDLGFVSDNPSSAEAIKASHETLGVMARKAQRSFGTSILNVGYLASCLRDDYPYLRSQVYKTKVKWEPIFVPDASTLSLIGDGTIKINQALDGYITKDVLHDLTGIKGGNDE